MACEFSEFSCPKCGSTLLIEGFTIWCSLVGKDQSKGCDWGCKEEQTVGSLFRALTAELEQVKGELAGAQGQFNCTKRREIKLREALEYYAEPGSNMHAYGWKARVALGQGEGKVKTVNSASTGKAVKSQS